MRRCLLIKPGSALQIAFAMLKELNLVMKNLEFVNATTLILDMTAHNADSTIFMMLLLQNVSNFQSAKKMEERKIAMAMEHALKMKRQVKQPVTAILGSLMMALTYVENVQTPYSLIQVVSLETGCLNTLTLIAKTCQ
jgi:hypothetical protein